MAQHMEIREALAAVWPKVREGIAEQIRRNNGRRLSSMNKRIVEQTLWELSKADRLLTPERVEVIEKARAWKESWGRDAPTLDDEQEDRDLYAAVEKLP